MTAAQFLTCLLCLHIHLVASLLDLNNDSSPGTDIQESIQNSIQDTLEDIQSTVEDNINKSPSPNHPILENTEPINSLLDTSLSVDTILDSPVLIHSAMENPEPTHSVMDTPMLINSIMESTDPINSIMESTDPINSIMESTEPINSTLESTQPFNYVMESPMLINSTLESTDPIDSVMESPLLINSTLEDPIDYVMESPELANASLHETKTLVPSLPEVVLSYNSTSLSPSLDTSSSFLSILQSPDWKSLSVEDRFDAFINSPAPENLLNVTSSELTPDLRQSMESLYPFKRYRRTLTDPITTVSTLHAVVRSEPRFLARVILTRDDDKAVAFGLRVPAKFQKELSERTPDRNDDGDVIFIKGLAYAGLEGRSSSSLANIIISSLNDYNKNQIRPFVKSVPVVRKYLKKVLNDSDYLKQIVDMDANDEAPISLNLGRKLLVRAGSPIDAFTCSYCFPNQVCEVCFWCDKKLGKELSKNQTE